jgi:hypothetical protein
MAYFDAPKCQEVSQRSPALGSKLGSNQAEILLSTGCRAGYIGAFDAGCLTDIASCLWRRLWRISDIVCRGADGSYCELRHPSRAKSASQDHVRML